MNIPYLLEGVGCPADTLWNYGSLAGKIWSAISARNMKRAMKNAPFALYVADFLYRRYPVKGGRYEIVSDVVIPEIKDSRILSSRLDKIEQKTGKITVGLIGSIDVRYKGQDVLLKAIGLLRDDMDIEALFVGGKEGTWIKNLANELDLVDKYRLLYTLKPGEEIFDFLDNIDIYIHPSSAEGLPRVVVEAMSRGCPILASKVGGIPELIDPKYTHNPGDYKELARQIKLVAGDKDQLKKMATRNFEASQKYAGDNLDNKRHSLFVDFADYVTNYSK
ncbi:MAG: glycosyltransferase family 4 protein [Rikenellaceae bacterium]|nr:glycosyltransferase family 4 protein [Rikenellaceae bacterium]